MIEQANDVCSRSPRRRRVQDRDDRRPTGVRCDNKCPPAWRWLWLCVQALPQRPASQRVTRALSCAHITITSMLRFIGTFCAHNSVMELEKTGFLLHAHAGVRLTLMPEWCECVFVNRHLQHMQPNKYCLHIIWFVFWLAGKCARARWRVCARAAACACQSRAHLSLYITCARAAAVPRTPKVV